MNPFTFNADEQTIARWLLIAENMAQVLGITREEAIARINKSNADQPIREEAHPFTFDADEQAMAYCLLIADDMVEFFGITREEAIGRINRGYAGQTIRGELDWIYHWMPEDLAKSIYYGPSVQWRNHEEGLKPEPYP